MIVTEILGNLRDLQPVPSSVDRVRLSGDEQVKRIQRLVTDAGREVGLRLPSGAGDLHDGDVLAWDGETAIVVAVRPTDVLVISPETIHQMGVIAHALGNRHLPAQFDGETMIVRYDHTVVDTLRHLGVPYQREDRLLPEPLRHAEHTH